MPLTHYCLQYFGADIGLTSLQPDTRKHCKTTDTASASRGVPVYSPSFCQAEYTWVAGSASRWFIRSEMVTHPGANRAQRSSTSLIKTNALPLSQIATAKLSVIPTCILTSL